MILIGERKPAAQKLQKQIRPETNYITEFQTITTYLDRDKDLADKFQEDPKQNIGSALIYFPTDPEHVEELFERAQKVDHEQWSRQDYKYIWTTNVNYYVITRDRCYYAGCKSQDSGKQRLCFRCDRKRFQDSAERGAV